MASLGWGFPALLIARANLVILKEGLEQCHLTMIAEMHTENLAGVEGEGK